jgi:hypothetical protein
MDAAAWDLLDRLTPMAEWKLQALSCGLCHRICRRPCHSRRLLLHGQVAICCPKVYCSNCLVRERVCPNCRTNSDGTVESDVVSSIILAETASCPKCPASMPLSSLARHLELHSPQ